jgi:hypothetical protein
MHVSEVHAYEVHAHQVDTRQMHAHQMHAHEVTVGEPEMKSVIKDELFQGLEDIIKEVGGEIDPRVYPG